MSSECEICGNEMDKGSCVGKIEIAFTMGNEEFKESYDRITFGGYGEDTDTRCGDCAVEAGQIHHWGCDNERCPKCSGQALGCECDEHGTNGRYSIVK